MCNNIYSKLHTCIFVCGDLRIHPCICNLWQPVYTSFHMQFVRVLEIYVYPSIVGVYTDIFIQIYTYICVCAKNTMKNLCICNMY